MDVEIVDGNLLDFPNDINFIAHSCNTSNIMGGGIAKQIKSRYPVAYLIDQEAFQYKENSLGKYSFIWTDKTCQKGIYNMYTQDKIGEDRSVNYEAFYVALKGVENHLFEMNVSKHEYDPSPHLFSDYLGVYHAVLQVEIGE